MSVTLGINPITWTNDDMPELGGDIPLETCLAETHEAGFAGIELGGKFPREAGVLRLFTEHPASVSETYQEHFKFAVGFGSRMLIAGTACCIHGILPFLFGSTGSHCASGNTRLNCSCRLNQCPTRKSSMIMKPPFSR